MKNKFKDNNIIIPFRIEDILELKLTFIKYYILKHFILMGLGQIHQVMNIFIKNRITLNT